MKGRLLARSGRDMRHVSAPRLAPRSAESHHAENANPGHKKKEIYAKRFIAPGAAVNLRPRSVGRGRILSGARCEVGRSPCTSSPHTYTLSGRARRCLAEPSPGARCRGSYAIHMHRGCASVYLRLAWVWRGATEPLLLLLPHVREVRISCCKE